MYPFIFGLTIIKSINPYFRKHLLNILDSHDLLFINSFFISLIVFFIFLYKLFFDKKSLKTIAENYQKLTLSHYICILLISILTVSSSLLLYEFDKKYNTPLMNTMFIRCISILALFFTGFFLFKEKYNWKQILGLVFIIIGFFLTSASNEI
jgi:drug/metabolite transporter (DMT)-like permease